MIRQIECYRGWHKRHRGIDAFLILCVERVAKRISDRAGRHHLERVLKFIQEARSNWLARKKMPTWESHNCISIGMLDIPHLTSLEGMAWHLGNIDGEDGQDGLRMISQTSRRAGWSLITENSWQSEILRDCLGPDAWRSPRRYSYSEQARAMAAEILEEERWHEITILADLLMDEACENEILIRHLQGFIPDDDGWASEERHCLGCWALQEVIGNGSMEL